MESGGAGTSRRKVARKEKRKGHAQSDQQTTQNIPAQTPPPFYDYRPQLPIANPENASLMKPYPFGELQITSSYMRTNKEKLEGYEILNPIYPDENVLRAYNLLEPVKEHFNAVGIFFPFFEHVGVFEDLVREFIYSFNPIYEMRPKPDAADEMYKFVLAWEFQIGGTQFTMVHHTIRRVFGISEELVQYPSCSDDIWNTFWQEITGVDSEFRASQKASRIRDPVWKTVHRLIATTIYLRPDMGRFVTNGDYNLMCCMRARLPIDTVVIYTKALAIPSRKRGKFIGGGHLISLISLASNFDPTHGTPLPRRFLGKEEFDRRKLGRVQEPDAAYISDGEAARRPRSRRSATSSSTPPAPAGFEELTSMMRSLTTYTQDGFRWQGEMAHWEGNMMRNIHSHLQIPGFVEPPSWTGVYGFTGDAAAAQEHGTDGMDDDAED